MWLCLTKILAVPNPEDERNPDAYALVSFYGPRDEDLYEDSFGCLWACTYSGNNNLATMREGDRTKGVSRVDFPTWGWLVSPPWMPTIFFSDPCEKP